MKGLVYTDIINDGIITVHTEILQETHYYPFGEQGCSSHMKWLVAEVKRSFRPAEDRGAISVVKTLCATAKVLLRKNMEGNFTATGYNQKYRYNGKELYGALGWYDYGARYYDPTIGRFTSVDPLAEKYPGMTPYNYVGNNPINNIDIKGDSITPVARALVGDDNQGFIRTATTELRENSPFTAGIADGTHFILSAVGLNMLDNLIFGTAPVTERVVEAASIILTPVPAKGPKPLGKNRISDTGGPPNGVQSNKPNTTIKKYNSDGNVVKEWNKGHPDHSKNSKNYKDHVHDYIIPGDKSSRQPARAPKKNELFKDFRPKKNSGT